MNFSVYRTEAYDPRHTSEAGMVEEASFRLMIADPKAVQIPSEYAFDVEMCFGATEFTVTAVDRQTKRDASAKVAFAHGR